MGLGQKFGSDQDNFLLLGSGQVSHLWLEFRFGKFPPKNPKFFNFFPFRMSLGWVKKYLGQRPASLLYYMLRVKSMLGSGQGPSLQFSIDFFLDWEGHHWDI